MGEYYGFRTDAQFGEYQALAIDSIETSQPDLAPIPEPGTLLLLGGGLVGLAAPPRSSKHLVKPAGSPDASSLRLSCERSLTQG